MASEVVVVVEDQNTRSRPGALVEEETGRQPAQPPTYNDHVIAFARVLSGPRASVTEAMRNLKRTRVAAPHARRCRWVVRLLRPTVSEPGVGTLVESLRGQHRTTDSHGDPIEEVTAGDAPAHSEVAVIAFRHRCPPACRSS